LQQNGRAYKFTSACDVPPQLMGTKDCGARRPPSPSSYPLADLDLRRQAVNAARFSTKIAQQEVRDRRGACIRRRRKFVPYMCPAAAVFNEPRRTGTEQGGSRPQ